MMGRYTISGGRPSLPKASMARTNPWTTRQMRLRSTTPTTTTVRLMTSGGVSTSVDPACPDAIKASSDKDSSSHDLGSGDAPADPEVIDLTSDDGPTYDLGWDVRPASPLSPLPPSSSRLSPAPPSPGDMGDDTNIKRALPLDGEFSSHSHSHSRS